MSQKYSKENHMLKNYVHTQSELLHFEFDVNTRRKLTAMNCDLCKQLHTEQCNIEV